MAPRGVLIYCVKASRSYSRVRGAWVQALRRDGYYYCGGCGAMVRVVW